MKPPFRRALVGLITFVVSAPVSFFLFFVALFAIPDYVADPRSPTMVAEVMFLPAAVLATGVITAVVASWMAGWLGGDRRRTDLNRVVRGNLIWAILPALPALAYPYVAAQFAPAPDPGLLLGVITLIWTTATAVRLAFRYRKTHAGNAAWSLAWLIGTALALAAIIFTVSLFSPLFP